MIQCMRVFITYQSAFYKKHTFHFILFGLLGANNTHTYTQTYIFKYIYLCVYHCIILGNQLQISISVQLRVLLI